MGEEQFGTTEDYLKAFTALFAEGIADHHKRLLMAHLTAFNHATTWPQLAEAVGYPNGSSVHLHYGKFAERLASHLGLSDKPQDPNGSAWWLYVLVKWAEDRDPKRGHMVFIMRRPVVEALQKLGIAAAGADTKQSNTAPEVLMDSFGGKRTSWVPTFLLTWNPAVWDGEIFNPDDWSCGRNRRIKIGDRLFLLRQGTEPRGIVASGHAITDVFEDDEGIHRVSMAMDTLLDPDIEDILPRDELLTLNAGLDKPMHWGTQISGIRIPDVVAERLEAAWAKFLSGRLPPTDEVRQAFTLPEGAVRQVTVNAYERNPEARRLCIEHHGRSCVVCEMSFRDVYGPVADGFIHVHHLTPLSETDGEYMVDPVADLRPVCPNCHAVLHLGGQCRSIAEVQQLLAQQRRTAPTTLG